MYSSVCYALMLVLSSSTPYVAGNDDPVAVFIATDLLAGPRALEIPAPGAYTVKLWSTAGRVWSMEMAGDVARFRSKEGKADAGWSTVGVIDRKAPGRIQLVIEGHPLPTESGATKSRRPSEPRSGPALPVVISVARSADFTADRALGLVASHGGNVSDARATKIRTNQEGVEFRAPSDARAWRNRAQRLRESLSINLGLEPAPPKTDLHPRIFGKIERDGYTIEKVVIETLPGFTLSGNLYRPKSTKGSVPLILSPHGHWSDGRVNPEVQPRCVRWAQLGCVVFLYDMVGYNDTKVFGHGFLNDRLRRLGISLATLQTWNSIRALDFLLDLPDVDPARVACTGESGGGTQTFLLSALDDRVRFAAPIVMVSDSFQGGCSCENAAGLRLGTDNVEFAALTAPRPMKLVGATGDWTAKTMSNAYPTLRRIYELVGDPNDLSADVFDFPHNYNETSRNSVYAFLAPRLLGIAPDKTKEGPVKIEDPATLRTHTDEDPRVDLATPAQLDASLANMRRRQLDRLAPGTASAPWEASRGLLRRILEVRSTIEQPTPFELDVKPTKRFKINDFAISHALIGRKGTGEQIPVVLIEPTKPNGRLTVYVSERGKGGLIDSRGELAPLVSELLALGHSVVGFDPLFTCESLDPTRPTTRRPSADHYDTYNRTLAADRLQDLAAVVAWAGTLRGVDQVNLAGDGEGAVLALLARPVIEGVARTSVDLAGFDYGDGSSAVSPGIDLPGVLQFGGLPVAAALSAPDPLWISRAGVTFDMKWPMKSYAIADSRAQLRIDDAAPDPKTRAAWLDDGTVPEASKP